MIIKFIKSLLSTKGLTGQFLSNYFWGNGKEMTLPDSAVQETKDALKEAFRAHVMSAMDYHSCVSRVGGIEGYEWWEGLAGVIGEFRWAPEFVKGGVIFHCWDRFDFNPAFQEIPVPMPKWIAEKAIQWALEKGYIKADDIEYQAVFWSPAKGGTLWVSESLINSLEGKVGKPFFTRWNVFIPNEELYPYNVSSLEIGNEGSFLRCKDKPFIKDYVEWFQVRGKDISYSYKRKEWNIGGKCYPFDKIIK